MEKRIRRKGKYNLFDVFKQLIPFTRQYRVMIYSTLVLTFVGALTAQVNPLVLKYAVDEVELLLDTPNPMAEGTRVMLLISAILFGIPHLAGMPSGIIGATMAGVLGLVLAKSLYETNGFFWAWTIHFIQDVIIIGTLFLLATKK